MATIKSYTDISQSRVLAGILPVESADMHYSKDYDGSWFVDLAEYTSVKIPKYVGNVEEHLLPCWSLAALLSVIPNPSLHKTFSGWRCDSYNKEETSCILGEPSDNPVDACVAMIIKLSELKKL